MSEAVVDELSQAGADQPVKKPPAYRAIFTPPGLALLGIMAVGLVARWANLLVLPIFADEMVHIEGGLAAQSGKFNTEGLFYLIWTSRVLHGWFLGFFYFLSGNTNLLLVGRLFSGFCGVVTIFLAYKIGNLLYSRRAGLLAASIWAIAPFTVWHERLILVDVMLATCTGLVLYFSLVLTKTAQKRPSNLTACLLGLSMAAAFLTKFNAALILPAPVLAVVMLTPPSKWKSFIRPYFLAYYIAGILVLPILALNLNGISSYQREKQFTLPNFALLGEHIANTGDWFYALLTLPLFCLVVVSAGLALLKDHRPGRFLLVTALIPLIFQGVFLSVSYSRYFLFFLLPLLILAAGQLDRGLNWFNGFKPDYSKLAGRLLIPALVLLALPMLWLDFQIVTDPVAAALPQADRYQYIEGPWNATGIEQVTTFLQKEQAQANRQLIVFTTLSIPSLGLELEFYRDNRFKQVQVDLIPGGDYVKLDQAFSGPPAYLVAMNPDENRLVAEYKQHYPTLNFVPVLTVPKPGNKVSWEIYRLDRN